MPDVSNVFLSAMSQTVHQTPGPGGEGRVLRVQKRIPSRV